MVGAEVTSASTSGERSVQSNGAERIDVKDPAQILVGDQQMEAGDLGEEWTDNSSGFRIPEGTLELVEVTRQQWRYEMELPLPPPSPIEAPILHEFSRPWRALRLPVPPHEDSKIVLGDSVMKSYEPQYTPGEPTFASEVRPSSFLEPRVAVPEAQAFLIAPRVRFNLGTVEPLVCKMIVYDIVASHRVTEEFCFRIPGPMLDKLDCTIPPVALVYVLPTLQLQNLYLVLKVSKVLVGDGDIATAPYCSPDKFASPAEQQKLVEKAKDCGVRLGRFHQPLAWGTIPLLKGVKRPMTLFRQRTCIPEEQRLSLILDAIRGTLKEKIVPSQCEFDVEDISPEELCDAKFKTQSPATLPRLKIADPFSEQKVIVSGKPESDTNEQSKEQTRVKCQEVQPFCPPSLVPTFGMTGSGPVAVAYVNALYVYPLQVEKCQHRNIAIRVQLLQKEVDAVRGVEETNYAVLRAIYRANNQVGRSAYALVGYHQKNPQFEDEIKICLPENLTADHHLLFTFYHVHCKKLQPNQSQQDLVGYATLPLLGKDGTIMQDSKYALNVTPAPISSKPSTTGGGISLSPGYVDAARDAVVDNTKTVFTCRGRVVSSVHSQDSAVADFLKPFHGRLKTSATAQEDAIVSRLMGLSQSGAPNVRYFFFMIAKFVLGYLRYGTSLVRWSAFRTLLAVMEKASWNPRGSLKIHEMNRVLHDFVHIVFDENSINDPNRPQSSSKTLAQNERKSVFGALLETWHNVLNNKASIEENVDTKRMSLTYSNVLLQLILKSMAMKLLDQCSTPNNHDTNSLPKVLPKNDEVMLERVLGQLIACTGDTSNGLLLQKEVNRSLAYFCSGVFLVVKNVFPARVVDRYMKWVDVQGDANSLRHIWFPFLHILVDFEFFATVNGASQPGEKIFVKSRAWLAKSIFEKLLLIVDTQKEQKIRVDAVRLLRRMFAAQVYNQRFQSPEYQEQIALLYYPLFPSIAQLTMQGKLLSSRVGSNSTAFSGEAKSVFDLQKEMLACVGHLLCSVSDSHLSSFFRSVEDNSYQVHPVHLKPTKALAFYHRALGKQTPNPPYLAKLKADELSNNNIEQVCECSVPTGGDSKKTSYEESRVHACLALIQRMLETFLGVESPTINAEQLWQQLLSPDLSACETETGLSLLEHRLAHRRSFQHRAGGGLDTSAMATNKTSLAESGSDLAQSASDGSTTHKSLPRNWSKHYAGMQQRRSAPTGTPEEKSALTTSADTPDVSASSGHTADIAALQHAVAYTTLRVLKTAVDQYEPVIRLVEGPRIPCMGKQRQLDVKSSLKAVTMSQALVLLGSLVDLLFQLLQRASQIECLVIDSPDDTNTEEKLSEDHGDTASGTTQPCFVVSLLQYLQAFVWRFCAALFAVRIPGLPLIHDQQRIQLLVSIAAAGKESNVRRHAAILLSQLFAVCYEQTGSFLLVKAPVLKVLTSAFFPTQRAPHPSLMLSCTASRDLLDEMRSFPTMSRDSALSLPFCFHIQFIDLLNDLTTKVHAFERWQGAFDFPDGPHDFEEIEEGVDRVAEDISPHWLLEEKLTWLNALLRLHIRRKCFDEAVCCKIAAIECVQRAGLGNSSDNSYLAHVQQWVVGELCVARDFAKKADWIEKELLTSQLLLVCLKQQRRFNEYQETLRYIDTIISRLAERQENGQRSNSSFSFYRVRYAGGCVPALIAKDEFIYKRSKFVSLGEFVAEMKAMLRAKYPQCERVDVVPEPKSLTGTDNNPNAIFLRVTTVEEALPEELKQLKTAESRSQNWRIAFKFAVPFTLGSSSPYGKTSEQMKRITFMSVARTFPCRLNRQRVQRRHEETRCPIENSMDDIRKRCELLRAEIEKENAGRTDLKTLTLVLKGSVDTHVHGGVPEVLDSFLAAEPARLVDAHGNAMSYHDSLCKRHELANLLVEFAQLCWQCLLISHEAFRRSNQPNGSQHLSAPSSMPPPAPVQQVDQQLPHLVLSKVDAANSNFLPPVLPPFHINELPVAAMKPLEPLHPLVDVSPLQTEFEHSFASLVGQIASKIPFEYAAQPHLSLLQQQTSRLLKTPVPAPAPTPASVTPLFT